jgi:transcriptional regulator with XRE-family HTH domain
MGRNKRIKQALKVAGVSQQALADELNVTQASINQRLNAETEIDSVDFINAVAKLTSVTAEFLITGSNPQAPAIVQEPADVKKYLSGKGIRPVTVVVNQQGRELMTYVPVKAQAGYMKGFGDPHFLEKLPAFSLPILKDGAYRMFEVDGDSMLQLGGGGLHDGDIVIAQYLEDMFTIRDNRVYVVISIEGVVVKRCINRLKDKDNPILICNSDNKNGQHAPIILRAHELLEVWELKAFISRQLNFSTDLWDIINDLQVQQALMKDRLKDIEQNKLIQ